MSFRKLLKHFIITVISLYVSTKIILGFSIQSGLGNILFATFAFTILNTFVRPLLKVLLLPINLLTLGTFRWLANIIVLYLLIYLAPQVNINGFNLATIPLIGVVFPSLSVGRFFATIFTSLSISLTQSLLYWLIK